MTKKTAPIIIYLLLTLGLSEISEAHSKFQDSGSIRRSCAQAYQLPDNYDVFDVHGVSNPRFDLSKRIQCLVPNLTDYILKEISYFETSGYYSEAKGYPFLLQVFGHMVSSAAFQKNPEVVLHLNKVISALWLLQMTTSNADAKVLASLSLASAHSSSNKLAFIKQAISRLSIDDSIYSKFNDGDLQTLVCTLNPARYFCPEKILFSSDIKHPAELYVVIQKLLRSDSYFSSNLEVSYVGESFCEKLSAVTQSMEGKVPVLQCKSKSGEAMSISSFLREIGSFDQYFSVAVQFNMDRIRNSVTRKFHSEILIQAIYLKDVQTSVEESDFIGTPNSPSSETTQKIVNELNLILKEGSDDF
jgi:hypothetical protein